MRRKPPPLDPHEQAILQRVHVRLIRPDERTRWDALLTADHYLHSAHLVGEQLRYVAEVDGQWVALLGWAAASYHLRPREAWIGWNTDQRRARLHWLANNARFLILEPGRWPNLASRVLARCCQRLSADWQAAYGHPIVAVESFVDSQLFRGTAYKAAGWEALGKTAGFERVAQDFYVPHERPKQLWVKALDPRAREWLRADELPPALTGSERPVLPRCREKPPALGSLWERLHLRLPDPRSRHGRRHHQATILAITFVALLCGVRGGHRQLEAFAKGLNQGQRRRLRCWYNRKSERYEVPDESSFLRVLGQMDAAALGALLVEWQAERLGGHDGPLLALDGKSLRAGGQHLLGAMNLGSGRFVAAVPVGEKTNEIPVAHALLEQWQLDGSVALLDALHTQLETARRIVQAAGGDYLLTIKANQKGLLATAQTLLPPSVPPCGRDVGTQPRVLGTAGGGRANGERRTTRLPARGASGATGAHARARTHGPEEPRSRVAGDEPDGGTSRATTITGPGASVLGH